MTLPNDKYKETEADLRHLHSVLREWPIEDVKSRMDALFLSFLSATEGFDRHNINLDDSRWKPLVDQIRVIWSELGPRLINRERNRPVAKYDLQVPWDDNLFDYPLLHRCMRSFRPGAAGGHLSVYLITALRHERDNIRKRKEKHRVPYRNDLE